MSKKKKPRRSKRSALFRLLGLTLILTLTSGCADGVPFHGEIAARPSAVLELSWARASRTDEGIVVLGQVQQVHCCAHHIAGHLHLEAQDARGVTLAHADVAWGEFISRQLHSASFKALLPVPRTASVTKIVLQFSGSESS